MHLKAVKIICLNIPGDYEFVQPELVSLLKIRVGHVPMVRAEPVDVVESADG